MKNTRHLPSLEILQSIFDYNPETGEFRWKRNGEKCGSIGHGYLLLSVNGKQYRSHRIGWSIYHGELLDPDWEIDHINGDRSDNRIVNLRVVRAIHNMWNQGARCNNTSGVRGVNFDRQTGCWRARIKVRDKEISLGRHETLELAKAARVKAEKEYYGEFAPHQLG